jgi:hypothetical protein
MRSCHDPIRTKSQKSRLITVILEKRPDLSVVACTYDVGENADLAGGLVYRGPDIRGGMEGQRLTLRISSGFRCRRTRSSTWTTGILTGTDISLPMFSESSECEVVGREQSSRMAAGEKKLLRNAN